MQAELKAIVEQSLKKARENDSRQNIGQAYAYYIAVIELSPENRPKVQEEFTDVLCKSYFHYYIYFINMNYISFTVIHVII